MSVWAAGRQLWSCWTGKNERVESAQTVSRPLRAARAVMALPGMARDVVTKPVAMRVVALWCSGEKYERACLRQAYDYADHAIKTAANMAKKGNSNTGLFTPEEWRSIEELAGLIVAVRSGVELIGCTAQGVGSGFRWVGKQFGRLSNALSSRGRDMSEADSRVKRAAGGILRAISCAPWAFSYVPSVLGHVMVVSGQQTEAVIAAANMRKRLAEEIFLPLILKGNVMAKQRVAQGCLNACANTGYLYAVGLFDVNHWASLGSSAVSMGNKAIFAAEAVVGGWIWAPIFKSSACLLSAACKRKKQIGQLKQELFQANPRLEARWSGIPGGTDFLLGIFLESQSLLYSHYTDRPEEFVQTFCDWTSAAVDAGVIAAKYRDAGERN